MSEPYIAEVKILAENFAPRGWAFCDGQLLPIAQNTALFALVGTTYGGDGRTTLGLPGLQGRAAMHPGRGPGLTSRRLGEKGGDETVTLTEATMAAHPHGVNADSAVTNVGRSPTNNYPTTGGGRGANLYNSGAATPPFKALDNTGGGGAHNNLQPYLALNYVIALTGVFPQRS